MANSEDWVALLLNSRSEGEDPQVIQSSIQRTIRSEVFIPAIVTQIGDDQRVTYLVEGYAFIRRGAFTDSNFLKLEMTRFVQEVMTVPGTFGRQRRLAVVTDADVRRMRQQIQTQAHQGIGIGDKVQITTGPYRNLEATVIEEIPEQGTVQVYVELRSKRSIVTIPRSGLTILERAPLSPIMGRLMILRGWVRQVRPIILWRGELVHATLQDTWTSYERLTEWGQRGSRLYCLTALASGMYAKSIEQVQMQHARVQLATTLDQKADHLRAFIRSFYDDPTTQGVQEIQRLVMDIAWLDDLDERIRQLDRSLDELAHDTMGDEHLVQNILVDGHNLFFRCLHAPGMGDLADSQGRPTGVILGVLRGLGALKKRWPDARVYVAWDGSSQRRKKMFGEYKSNRPARVPADPGAFSPLKVLQEILPFLGVWQITNPDEEADDIIATMVRGELAQQENLVFSSDRDLLQLVSPTTRMLYPSSGIRKEILYDEEAVEDLFGVPPGKLLQLRAFTGDTSDNIPGVPRVPKKVFKSLIQAHGTVSEVYKSGLTGLSRGQYERLRGSEPQIRINLAVMALVVDLKIDVAYPDVDPDLARSMLSGFEINPQPILAALLDIKEGAEVTDDA